MEGRPEKDTVWVRSQLSHNTFRHLSMKYTVADGECDTGYVLVSFKEMSAAGKGEVFARRLPTSVTPLVISNMRRCVPYSQIESALELCHRGPHGVGHAGQDGTWYHCLRMFDGITRDVCRKYVQKCGICQAKQPKMNKAPLTPIVSKALWERVVMDLVSYKDSPCNGYRYIWHAEDHYSKYHFARRLKNKTAAGVARCVEDMLVFTGGIRILQIDNGTEFKGVVETMCKQYGVQLVHSSPKHPQTNGICERYGGVLKRAISKWQQQHNTREWSTILPKVVMQLNASAPRTTKKLPHELVFGKQPYWYRLPSTVDDRPLDQSDIDELLWQEDDEKVVQATAPAQHSDTDMVAANLLSHLHLTSDGATTAPVVVVPSRTQSVVSLARVNASRTQQLESISTETGAADSGVNMDADHFGAVSGQSERPVVHYIQDDELFDCKPTGRGHLTAAIGEQLNAGPGTFWRLGAVGKGRCSISAVLRSTQIGTRSVHGGWQGLTVKEMFNHCDVFRRNTWTWMSQQTGAARKRLEKMLIHMGNAGDTRQQHGNDTAAGGAEAYSKLMEDLTVMDKDLGWDFLAVVSAWKSVNILIFTRVHSTTQFPAYSTQASQQWQMSQKNGTAQAECARQKKAKPGGSWNGEEYGVSIVLANNVVNPAQPFIVLFHRTEINTAGRMEDGKYVCETSGGGGHFESLAVTLGDSDLLLTAFYPDGATADMHRHPLHIAHGVQASHYQSIATATMTEQYNRDSNVVHYSHNRSRVYARCAATGQRSSSR